jgi:hypothetical protein
MEGMDLGGSMESMVDRIGGGGGGDLEGAALRRGLIFAMFALCALEYSLIKSFSVNPVYRY